MPCSICKKIGHNKKTCTFLVKNINKNNDDEKNENQEKLCRNTIKNDNIIIQEEIYDNIFPKLIIRENHKYNLSDLQCHYIKQTFNIIPKFGDIIQFSNDKAYDSYIIGYNNEFIYAPDYDDTGTGNLIIPYEITKYTKNAVLLYKNIHPNLRKIYLRHDDIFITKIMGLIDKYWTGKIAWLYDNNSIEVDFNENNKIYDDNKILIFKIDENLTYQKIDEIKYNFNKKYVKYKLQIYFIENDNCEDTKFKNLIKPLLYRSYYYEPKLYYDYCDIFYYEHIIVGPEEDKDFFQKEIYDFYEKKDHKKYIEKIKLKLIVFEE